MAGEVPRPPQVEKPEVVKKPKIPEVRDANKEADERMERSAQLQNDMEDKTKSANKRLTSIPGTELSPEYQQFLRTQVLKKLQLGFARAAENFRLRMETFSDQQLRAKARQAFDLGPAKLALGQEFKLKPGDMPGDFNAELYKQTLTGQAAGFILGAERYHTEADVSKLKLQAGYNFKFEFTGNNSLNLTALIERKAETGTDYQKTTLSPRVKGTAKIQGRELFFDAQVDFASKLKMDAGVPISEDEKQAFSAFLGTPIAKEGVIGVNSYVDTDGNYSISLGAIGRF